MESHPERDLPTPMRGGNGGVGHERYTPNSIKISRLVKNLPQWYQGGKEFEKSKKMNGDIHQKNMHAKIQLNLITLTGSNLGETKSEPDNSKLIFFYFYKQN